MFDFNASHLAPYADRLARKTRVDDAQWDSIAFQAQGLVDELHAEDAYRLLRSFSTARVLRGRGALQRSLLSVLRREKRVLKPRKLVSAWVSLDRADASLDEQASAFFGSELPWALPSCIRNLDADGEQLWNPRPANREWRKVHVMLAAGGCDAIQLSRLWKKMETATSTDGASIRAFSVDGLVSAVRAAALANTRAGVIPNTEFVQRLLNRVVEQTPWLDSWAASHVVLAAAQLGAQPGQVYDPIRETLLERCMLNPEGKAYTRAELCSGDVADLSEAERITEALALFDVHDDDIRRRLAPWLLQPLPPLRFARLAERLAGIGLDSNRDPQVARHVRATARSSEMTTVLGSTAAGMLNELYV